VSDAAVSLDGRHERRRQNAEAVVDAIYDLWREGELQPSAKQIADRSSVSLRSVFRYFDDLDTLVATAIERRTSDTDHHFAPFPAHGTFHERCDRLAAHRVAYQADVEALTDALRLHAPLHPPLAQLIARRLDQLRNQLAVLFEPELSAFEAEERAERLAALETATGYDAVRLLRVVRGFTVERAEAVIANSAERLLR